jgi:beta-phosphoglucomutase-like phosphatase (HAD superfamily)
MKLKAILFDHDGTLVDSEIIHYQLWEEILKSYGICMTLDDYVKYNAGIPTPQNAQRMVGKYDLPGITDDHLIEDKNIATTAWLSNHYFPLMPNAGEVLDYFFENNMKLAVVTGASSEGVHSTVTAHDLSGHFSTIVSGDDVENSKPAADCYLLAVHKLGLNPGQCIAIEDTENGVLAATSANIPCVAVASEISGSHDFSGAVAICSNLSDARNWIVENYDLES